MKSGSNYNCFQREKQGGGGWGGGGCTGSEGRRDKEKVVEGGELQ